MLATRRFNGITTYYENTLKFLDNVFDPCNI